MGVLAEQALGIQTSAGSSPLATRDKENTETTTQRVRQEEEGVYLQQITALALLAVLAGLQDPPCGASGA